MSKPFLTEMERSLHQDLLLVLLNWDPVAAEQLSLRIHAYEADGGVITERTDRLWERLTVRLFAEYHGSNNGSTAS